MMTEIEQKALELVNEVARETHGRPKYTALSRSQDTRLEALCRAIEQHEAFRQEVSDAVESLCNPVFVYEEYLDMRDMLRRRFIIAKPDPLVDALEEVWGDTHLSFTPEAGDFLRAALAKRGGRIVFDD